MRDEEPPVPPRACARASKLVSSELSAELREEEVVEVPEVDEVVEAVEAVLLASVEEVLELVPSALEKL